MFLWLVAAVAGTTVVAGRVDGKIVGRSDMNNLDLNSVDSEWSDYQDREVVVRVDDKNNVNAYVAEVNREDRDVRAGDECQTSSKCSDGEDGKRGECRCDPFEIARRAFGDTGKSNDHRTFEVVSEVASETIQGASAVGVRIPGVPGEMAGEKDQVMKVSLIRTCVTRARARSWSSRSRTVSSS